MRSISNNTSKTHCNDIHRIGKLTELYARQKKLSRNIPIRPKTLNRKIGKVMVMFTFSEPIGDVIHAVAFIRNTVKTLNPQESVSYKLSKKIIFFVHVIVPYKGISYNGYCV